MSTPVKVPALGESITEATIGSWRKKEGDRVRADEALVEIESEKATLEVPAPVGGVLRRVLKQAGDSVKIGEIIAELDEAATDAGAGSGATASQPTASQPAAASQAPAGSAPKPAAPAPRPPAPAAPTTAGSSYAANAPIAAAVSTNGSQAEVKASPAMRRMLAEHAIDAATVQGTGPAGRIEREDVLRATAQPASAPAATAKPAAPARPAVQAPSVGVPGTAPPAPGSRADLVRLVKMTPLRRTVARRLLEAQNNAAILTTFNEVNMAEVMALRERYQEQFQKRHGIKLGFMSFFVKAAVDALKAFPIVNSEVRGDEILYKDYFDIGVAVGGGKGLVVPVVRDADRLSLAEVERAIAELATRARDNKITPAELEGGTFTISNGGIYGSMLSTPILNPPQSGILGLHAIQKRPVAVGEAIALRPMMYVALSYDHRIVDGREAVQFLVRIKECIEDPERILIEV